MNESPISDPILIADDDLSVLTAVKGLLAMEGYAVRTAKDGREARRILEREPIALLLADLDMPYASGIDLLQHIRDRQIQTPVIIITGKGSIDTAVQAIKTGAYDYLTKPVDARRLRAVIPKALELYALRRSHNRLQQRLQELSGFDELIGEDPAMRQVYHRIEAVADTLATVLITGESGTGKELVARAIHRRSSRRQQPFVAINCSALPREILENELFGHEKGAFTGALQEKAGCFELAHQGSLFLDEIGDMPPDTQVKLLRVLEERSYRRLGGKAEITV
ncbi:sigma-54-dependent Fis family transcriptional regulator, partial [candidate division KSB1 bacterium]|nr:sigma-54-dependent Fis family transcriptional regulator [candidate division KSB1 bacterium]